MFTGIIEEVGSVVSLRKTGRSAVLELDARDASAGIRTGDSLAVDGVCLTVASVQERLITLDVMPETMNRTTFHRLKPGTRLNLERAMKLGDRLGGHLVTGHIDGTGRITERRQDGNATWLRIGTHGDILRYMVEKGSVAVDGISLTVVAVDRNSFSVSVIPVTQTATTILEKRTGDEVNIECDILGKYVGKLLTGGRSDSAVTLEQLARSGYL